jgi:hypothetical protein
MTCSNAFVVKLSPRGDALEYATYLGGSREDDGLGIAIDGSGNAYVAGSTGSPDFPFTLGAFHQGRNAPNPYGGASPIGGAFVAKINADGHSLAHAALLNDAAAYAICRRCVWLRLRGWECI